MIPTCPPHPPLDKVAGIHRLDLKDISEGRAAHPVNVKERLSPTLLRTGNLPMAQLWMDAFEGA